MNWHDVLMNIMFTVITVILPLITRYVVVLINTKIAEHTIKMEDENMKKYIQAATDAVSLAVITVQQTYTDTIKSAGKFDKDAAITAKNMAIEKAESIITAESKKYIEMLYGDFKSWIDQSIETMVRESKISVLDKVEVVPNEDIEYVADAVPVTE